MAKYKVAPAVTLNSKGLEVPDGWDVFVDGEWYDRFRTRRQARLVAHHLARS